MAETAVKSDLPEWVTIVHEGIGGTHRCTRDAFDLVWKDKGWKLADNTEAAVLAFTTDIADVEPVDDLDKLKIEQLQAVATAHSVDLDGATKKADIVAALKKAATEAYEPQPA